MQEQISRRNMLKGAAIGAASLGVAGMLGACSSGGSASAASASSASASASSASASASSAAASEFVAEVLSPKAAALGPDKGSNYDIYPVPDTHHGPTTPGTTAENLMSAITGETGATTKYAHFAELAEKEGHEQIARLFRATSDAEKIHIELEFAVLQKLDPSAQKPEPPAVEDFATDINLISGARGEIYETSDMYPNYIKVALDEGQTEACEVFTRAKLAEAYHAKWYMDAYNNIDNPSDDKYYLCPICGFIHKGENFTACPICLEPKENFIAY